MCGLRSTAADSKRTTVRSIIGSGVAKAVLKWRITWSYSTPTVIGRSTCKKDGQKQPRPARGVSECLSRMRRKSQVRFLGGGEVAIPPCYPAGRCQAVASGGGSAHDLTPLVPAGGGVRRGAGEQWPQGRWGPATFPGCQEVASPFRSQRRFVGRMGAKCPEKGSKRGFFQSLPPGSYWRNSFVSIQLSLQFRSKGGKGEIDVSSISILTCVENLARQTSAGAGKRSIS